MADGAGNRATDATSLSCPACAAALPAPPRGMAPACPGCGAAFRSPLVAALLSVALPGWGHLYLRRRVIASCELAVGIAVFGSALVNLGLVFARVVAGTASPLELLRICVPWGLVLVSYSLLDGAFTWLVSRHRVVLAAGTRTS